MTPRQAAQIKKCSLRTIRYWMSSGRLPVFHEGKGRTDRARIPLDALEKVDRLKNPKVNDSDLTRCPNCRSLQRGAYEVDGEAVAICQTCGFREPCPPDHYLVQILQERKSR